METKDRIRSMALHLFNRSGSGQVSFREIAVALEISPGHLFYHYRKKEEIIEELYDELVAKLDAITQSVYLLPPGMPSLYDSLHQTMSMLYEYRFLFLEMPFIMKAMPGLRKEFNLLLKRRSGEFKAVFDHLKIKGYLRSDLDEVQYQMLFRHFFIISNAWISDAEIFFRGNKKAMAGEYATIVFSILVPYFTPEALEEYASIRKN